ncbi:MAG: hypothetical protein ACO3A4_13695 [Silvanigrellaceae bacterium]
MNPPTMANHHPDIALSESEIGLLSDICRRTLSAQPGLSHWLQSVSIGGQVNLPFLPIRCFRNLNVSRYLDHELTLSQSMRTFRSSGSTNVIRASHHLGSTGMQSYEKSAVEGFLHAANRLGIPAGCPVISLVPETEKWPESSLAQMMKFWLNAGQQVHYVDVEDNPAALMEYVSNSPALNRAKDVIIFGTSLHHLTVARWQTERNDGHPFLSAKTIWFFDTGGTKGRTQHISAEDLQMQMKTWALPGCVTKFLSEYGMCELSSQAYSLEANRAGIFQCAPKLRSVILGADLKSTMSPGTPGFLSFIDLANVDSWPFIITEDVACHLSDSSAIFQLIGRAPDATVKGCSLNVRDNFRFDLNRDENSKSIQESVARQETRYQVNKQETENKRERTLFEAEQLIRNLNGKSWTAQAKIDLRASLQDWHSPEEEKQLAANCLLKGKSIAITASANIPITWVFPTTHAWLMGADRVDVFLPSPRQDDPVSVHVRSQICELAIVFNGCVQAEFVRVHNHRLPLNTNASHVLVFGHDETIRSIRNAFRDAGIRAPITGFGHFQNVIQLADRDTPEGIATITARWLGRGCLTPLVAMVPEDWTDVSVQKFAQEWLVHSVAKVAAAIPTGWQNNERSQFSFAHRHNLTELKALASNSSISIATQENAEHGIVGVHVDSLGSDDASRADFEKKLLDWAGCGWLSFIKPSQLSERMQQFVGESCSPGLWDAHQGRSWKDWLNHEHLAEKR